MRAGENKINQEISSPLKRCGDDYRTVPSGLLLCLDKEGSHLVFLYPWTPTSCLQPKCRSYRVSLFLKLLWHCEPGAAAFWLVNTVCVLGTRLQKRKSKRGLLKPRARTGGCHLHMGQSLLKPRKGLWWWRNPVIHFQSLWSLRNKLQVLLFQQNVRKAQVLFTSDVTLEFKVSATELLWLETSTGQDGNWEQKSPHSRVVSTCKNSRVFY